MTTYEENMLKSQNDDKIIFYDYISYKKAAGWVDCWAGDWCRPRKENLKKARYYAEFLNNLENYYFLGFPIKILLRSPYSEGHCHSSAVALSLYFEEFELVTCNLQTYAEHYEIKSGKKNDDFEHTFLITEIDGEKKVIDTVFGIITDLDTYNFIFNPNDIRIITSKELNKVKPYRFIKFLKHYPGSPLDEDINWDTKTKEFYYSDEEKYFQKVLKKHMDMCLEYTNEDNKHLEDFINRCLYRTSNSATLEDWKSSLRFKHANYQFEYPTKNMFSLVDDEFDEYLYATGKTTIQRNKITLENYHKVDSQEENIIPDLKEEENKKTSTLKNKMLSLVRKIKYFG